MIPNLGEGPRSDSRSRAEELKEARGKILIVEDNAADVFLIRRAIKSAGVEEELQVVSDGEHAVEFFDQVDSSDEAPLPRVVVLDINLPKKQGSEVLQHIRKSRRSAVVPVIAVSTSDSARDREAMAQFGANGYFRKPSDYEEFMKLGPIIRAILGDQS